MNRAILLVLLLVGCSSAGSPCVTSQDCQPDAGDPHYCEHYTCALGSCAYWWDGGVVTCGNTDCATLGDCAASTPTISISCVAGSCVGSQ